MSGCPIYSPAHIFCQSLAVLSCQLPARSNGPEGNLSDLSAFSEPQRAGGVTRRAGAQRRTAEPLTRPAISLGLTAAPVVTIPARQARAFRVIDNRTSELTSWDTDLLPDALAGLDDLDVFSFDDVLPLAAMDGKTDPDDIPEPPKNPVTRTGNLWVLGKHRIICGDSCDQQTVERLLDGAAPDLMVTDPPYGVGYDSSWRYKAGISTKGGAFGKSANDDQND